MNYLLLLGAGFSRNWGGWLATEAFEYLLGCHEIAQNDYLKMLLWKHRRGGGFEAALSDIQAEWLNHQQPKDNLKAFQSALENMFRDMNTAFHNLTDFDFQNDRDFSVRRFLTRFDAIFTLNQDLLMEYQYLNNSVQLVSNGKWNDGQIPGMRKVSHYYADAGGRRPVTEWVAESSNNLRVDEGNQPYFKLHGSSEWRDSANRDMLIMGGNKDTLIRSHEILKWYHKEFSNRLLVTNTRLMVIGYSFGDNHINKMIIEASKAAKLQMFIINPAGADIISNTNRTFTRPNALYAASDLERSLHPVIIGASRRSLREIFSPSAAVEHSKVMRFFE